MKTKISKKTQDLVMLGMLSAFLILMAFTPLGYFKYGVISITLLPIPVAIGANLCGYKGGAILGFLFGVTSFAQCFGLDPFGTLLFTLNPFFCIILCFIPRTAMGLLCGLISQALAKKSKYLAFIVSSLLAALLNTVLFVGLFIPFYGFNPSVREAFATDSLIGIITGLITVNAAIEAAASLVLGSSISVAVDVAREHL